jgi:hypothetical protein
VTVQKFVFPENMDEEDVNHYGDTKKGNISDLEDFLNDQ